MTFFPVLLFSVLFAFQVWVTWRVWRTDLYLRNEKFAQFRLIWFLPLLGAIIVYSVLTEEDHRQGPPPSHLKG
jgi:hypothetical protein